MSVPSLEVMTLSLHAPHPLCHAMTSNVQSWPPGNDVGRGNSSALVRELDASKEDGSVLSFMATQRGCAGTQERRGERDGGVAPGEGGGDGDP